MIANNPGVCKALNVHDRNKFMASCYVNNTHDFSVNLFMRIGAYNPGVRKPLKIH